MCGLSEKMANALNLKDAVSALEWVNKVVGFLEPYKPIKKKMKINHADKTSEIALVLNMPSKLKLKFTTTKIPAYQNFYIDEMLAEDFSPLDVSNYWKRDFDGSWILDPKNLPNCDKFLVRLKGKMPQEVISNLVFINEATNRDQTEESDRYWMKCMIKDIELIESMWEVLEIEDVNVGIKVGINRCFSAAIPSGLTRKLKASQRFIRAGHMRDREELNRAWAELHRAQRSKGGNPDELLGLINRLTNEDSFGKYIYVDEPYNLGPIKKDSNTTGILPNFMYVQALTDLNLNQYAADGYLVFNKKKYIEDIKENMNIIE
jgi:hypothetical protein